jgi:hypothetical protein
MMLFSSLVHGFANFPARRRRSNYFIINMIKGNPRSKPYKKKAFVLSFAFSLRPARTSRSFTGSYSVSPYTEGHPHPK